MIDFPELAFESTNISLRTNHGDTEIYDPLRKKWYSATPEEWVRQHVLQHFLNDLHYPPESIAVEKKVEINRMPKRFDILIYVKGLPAILVECKAPHVPITEEVFHQACRYNTQLGAHFTVMTNGIHTVCAAMRDSGVQFAQKIPSRKEWQ